MTFHPFQAHLPRRNFIELSQASPIQSFTIHHFYQSAAWLSFFGLQCIDVQEGDTAVFWLKVDTSYRIGPDAKAAISYHINTYQWYWV